MAQEPKSADPIVIFGDRTVALNYGSGIVRIGIAAQMVDKRGESRMVPTGMLALTIEGALELQADLHQLLSQLDAKGVVNLKPPRLDG